MSAKTAGYAATPHLLGPGPLWHKPGFKLPNYIENVAKGLMESGHDRSSAIAIAIGTIRCWAAGGGHVTPEVRAASAKAIAEWEALKSRAHATSHVQEDGMALALAGTFNSALHPHQAAGSPTGGQFAPARNAQAAQAQKAPGAKAAYDKAAGAKDAKAQIAGMTNDQLIALSKAAYSFKSNDPKVVALRIQIANEIAKRGGNVNDYGGLGKPTAGGPKPLKGGPAAPAKKPAAVKAPAVKKSAAAKAPVVKKAPVKLTHRPSTGLALTVPMVTAQSGPAVTMNGLTSHGAIRAAVKAHATVPARKQPGYRRKVIAAAKRAGAMKHVPPAWLHH